MSRPDFQCGQKGLKNRPTKWKFPVFAIEVFFLFLRIDQDASFRVATFLAFLECLHIVSFYAEVRSYVFVNTN